MWLRMKTSKKDGVMVIYQLAKACSSGTFGLGSFIDVSRMLISASALDRTFAVIKLDSIISPLSPTFPKLYPIFFELR